MPMFGKTHIDPTQIIPTSKMSLKLSCLQACGNDITEADKLYKYIATDLANLPDIEPMRPGLLQRADEIFGWIGSHKDDIMQGVSYFQQLRGAMPTPSTPADVPPIPDVK